MSMAVGTKGIDSGITVDSVAARKQGSSFQVRYSAGAATDPNHMSHAINAWKLLKPGELSAIIQSGQDFLANDEWYEDRMYGGAAFAEVDARATLAFWRARGLAKGSSITLNHDTYMNMSKMGSIDSYFDRYNHILGGEYVANGFYGPLAAARQLARSGRIKHYWIPEAASWFGSDYPISGAPAPANSLWDLWAPNPDQVSFAIKWLLGAIGNDVQYLESIIWQDRNKWFSNRADENIVLKGVRLGSHREHVGVPTKPPAVSKIYQGAAVPSLIARNSGQYLGLISGPPASHGGHNASERPIIRMLQQRLIACGFVPNIHNTSSPWADGLFEQPTKDAVTRFQRAHMPGTKYFGQVWWDDWTKLFNL